MVDLSVAIMAHPDRQSYIPRLTRRLPQTTTVAWDRFNDRWDTGRRAIAAYDPQADYHLVLQDDAILPPTGFMTGLCNALRTIPRNSPLVLFTTRATKWLPVFRDIPRSASYLVMDRIWWGVGIVYPTHSIPELLSHGDSLSSSQYDHRAGDFYAANHIPVYYTWPNLVNHRAGPSLVEGRTSRRRAYNFTTRPPGSLQWDGLVVKVDPPASVSPNL